MKKTEIKTINIVPSNGILIKVQENENGKYNKDEKRYDIITAKEVFSPEADVENWSEYESLETFIKENGFIKVSETNN